MIIDGISVLTREVEDVLLAEDCLEHLLVFRIELDLIEIRTNDEPIAGLVTLQLTGYAANGKVSKSLAAVRSLARSPSLAIIRSLGLRQSLLRESRTRP